MASAKVKLEKFLPRAASVTFLMSSTSCGTLRNFGTGAHSFVSLLIKTPVPTPQLGWQPQLTEPQGASGPWERSAKAEKVLISEIGNQSRVGSILPTCALTSLAKCDRVYRCFMRRSGVISSSRPVKDDRKSTRLNSS